MTDKLILNRDTKLSELLSTYPCLKEALADVNEKFSLLNSPLGKIMANKATIAEMSKRSGMDESVLIERLQILISEKANLGHGIKFG